VRNGDRKRAGASKGARLTISYSMRIFIAIEIPQVIRTAIAELINSLKPAANNVRWSRPEGLHITLKFLGEVEPSRIDEVTHALSAVHSTPPFSVAIQSAGYFPNERSPRVVWLGIQAGAELPQLACSVEAALIPLGFENKQRAFSPHLTLGRVKPPGKITAVQESLQRREPLLFGSFMATEFFLYESKPSRTGSVYNKLARFQIAPAAQNT
jgi:2'-5' RNA ligase